MAIARTAANVRPINCPPHTIVNDVPLNATVEAGELVYHDGTGWALAALTNATTGAAQGVCLKSGAAGARVDVLTGPGRVTGWTGLTPGGKLYSAASGEVSHTTSAQYSGCVGWAISETDWFFTGQPPYTVP